MSTRIARREFLKRATLGLGGLTLGSTLIDALVSDVFQKAYAQTVSQSINPSGYYIHLTLPGGPPRWYFDLPLTPNGQTASNFIAGGFGTRLEKVGGAFKSVYSAERHVVDGKTIYLPPVWNYDLASKNFSDLLPHTAFIRGVNMEINNHALSSGRQVAPIIGGLSINGVVADGSTRPMPSIVDSASSAGQIFKSAKGYGSSAISYAEKGAVNPVSSLLSPFKDYTAGRPVHSSGATLLQNQAFSEFEKYANQSGITASALSASYDQAIDLMEKNIFQLAEKWEPTVRKYRDLMTEAMSPAKGSLPGIYDTAIASQANGLYQYDNTPTSKIDLTDIRDMVNSMLKAPHMAENFAVAEILLDQATSNMNLAFLSPSGVNSGKGLITMTHDQHNVGSVVSTMMTTLFYRAFLGCLTEFVSVLKSKQIFDRTVIHISSEFNRTPRLDGSGADHGYMGSNATLISGMFNQVSVIGNVQKANLSNLYQGTFGVAASYELDGATRSIQVNDIARSITAMLGVQDIVTNGRPLFHPSGQNWIPRKNEANNV